MTKEEKQKIIEKIEKLLYYYYEEEHACNALNELKEFIDLMPSELTYPYGIRDVNFNKSMY